ncbi:ATP-binding protein [Bremerella cremea]|uniref:ATP-binding protein n=1 Tax=Blastopirellula marina TaxID=124 RepID=A0A2S8FUM6_9BACT|nr:MULTISPECIES: ATP-binding protein [Pirellulaceae]PQO35879.1 ATP-binding protein [Blastopirellula marina]RCS48556.1 ATP-binding protein [Bremerella cremea]
MADANKRINAGPTKRFFVEMLTRDIALVDAILDLLDNCVDGVIRDLKRKGIDPLDSQKPYEGYKANITANQSKFEITDNCGGIPEIIAEKSAFMLGRPDLQRDSELQTVGMYGIGMKRAMFKMGKHSVVISDPVDESPYKVEIPPEWLDDDYPNEAPDPIKEYDPWKLVLRQIRKGLKEHGTQITVKKLNEGVARQFKVGSTFLDDLASEISKHYAIIIDKGFQVTLNGILIEPAPLTLLVPNEIGAEDAPKIEPYIFMGTIEGVSVELAVGFYRPLVTEDELDDEAKVKKSREYAGWTVVCNDRVVLYNDKTYRTGWDTKGVTPGYHNQFISISGVVFFKSNDSMKLPLNTTKRGLDMDSSIYHVVIEYMREGLKKFTSFTNAWKRHEEETSKEFRTLSSRRITDVSSKLKAGSLKKIPRIKSPVGSAQRYSPELPRPITRDRQLRICFEADRLDIETVAEFLFQDSTFERARVGERCFKLCLEKAEAAQK